MTSPPAHHWWRRLSWAPPDDVNPDHFRALRHRGFSRLEAHGALLTAPDDLNAAFHAAIAIKHTQHTGSPYLYPGCELCENAKDAYVERRSHVRIRRESLADEAAANKAQAVEEWRERNAQFVEGGHEVECGKEKPCIRWCCPQPFKAKVPESPFEDEKSDAKEAKVEESKVEVSEVEASKVEESKVKVPPK